MNSRSTIAPVNPDAPSAVRVACTHCGLPVPRGRVDPNAEQQFCCAGCQTVFQMIRDYGLDPYYRIRRRENPPPEPARTTGRGYEEFANPAFERLYCRSTDDGLVATDLVLEGVHCAACVWLIEKLPRVVPGVVDARLSLHRSTVRLRWDRGVVDLSTIARRLDSLGYPSHPARGIDARHARTQEDRRTLIDIAVAGACAGNVMLLALALYAGWFSGMEAEYETLFRWLSMAIGVVVLIWPGRRFFLGALAALRTGTAHLDLPIALALAVGGGVGAFNTIAGTGDIYFDTLTVLVFLLLVGRFIQQRQQRRAYDAVELLFSLTPASAHLVDAGDVRDTPVEALRPGDLIEVRAGETFSVDGLIERGDTEVGEAMLTGESRARRAGDGDQVCAGTLNIASTVRVRVEAAGRGTRVGRLMQLIEHCAQQPSPIVRLADRVAGWFVLVIIALAAVTLGVWLAIRPDAAFDHTVALLIVACPCALGLATPLAVAVAIGAAAHRDIMIKGGDTLERLAQTGTILLDKTGTITAGQTRLARWHGPDELKPVIAAIECESSHHVARALVHGLIEQGTSRDDIAEVRVRDVVQRDGGIEAMCEGRRVLIGSPGFVAEQGIALDGEVADQIRRCVTDRLTPVVAAIDNIACAAAGFGDTVRPDAGDAIKQLKRSGWRVAVLSGDDAAIARHVAHQVGISASDVQGGMTPEAKVRAVDKAREDSRPVVMVGDGVNDAAALASADVGIAVHGGAEASLSVADVFLARPGLRPLVELAQLARTTRRTIRLNLAVSLAYNAAAVTLAMMGLINPLVAAVLMPISSITVVSLSLASGLKWGRSCP